MNETRTFLEDLFAKISESGWSGAFADALDDNLVFTATGTSPVAGRYEGKQAYMEQVLKRLSERLESMPNPVVDNMITEGGYACIQFHSDGATGKNGTDFSMHYCWVLKVENDKITAITGYYDSAKMIALFKDS